MATSKQLKKAEAAVKKKNYEYAAELYILHLKVHPDDVDARKSLRAAERANKKVSGGGGFMAKAKAKKLELQGRAIRVNKKDPERTMHQAEELLKQDPDCVPALVRLGEAASYANHNEVAISVFEDALGVDHNNTEALRLLGRVHEACENLDKALKCFQRLSKLDPKDPEALDKVKKIPAQITSKGFQKGAKEGFRGLIDKDEAEKLEKAAQRVRTPEQALERITELEPVVAENPKDTKTMRLIAELYLKANQQNEALQWCERALKVDPNFYLASEMRGDILIKRHENQIKKLEQAYRKTRDEAYKAKWAKAKKAKRDFEIDEYRRRAEAHPTEAGLRFPLGKALFEAGRIDDSITELQKAKGDPRKKQEAGYLLGQCFIKKKILKLALKELMSAREEIFEMNELKKDITYLIGRIYENANKPEKAASEYEQIAEADYNYKDVTKRLESISGL